MTRTSWPARTSWSTTWEPMNPPPPVTASCTTALSRVPYRPSHRPAPLGCPAPRATACLPELPARERFVHRGDGSQYLVDLRVAHIGVDRQADVPGSDVLGHGQRRTSVVREHGLMVEWQVVHLAGEPDPEPVTKVLL